MHIAPTLVAGLLLCSLRAKDFNELSPVGVRRRSRLQRACHLLEVRGGDVVPAGGDDARLISGECVRTAVEVRGLQGVRRGDRRVGEVYPRCMSRTNIDIDDAACRDVMERYHLGSKRDAVNLALRRLAAEPLDLDDARRLRGSG